MINTKKSFKNTLSTDNFICYSSKTDIDPKKVENVATIYPELHKIVDFYGYSCMQTIRADILEFGKNPPEYYQFPVKDRKVLLEEIGGFQKLHDYVDLFFKCVLGDPTIAVLFHYRVVIVF